MKAHERLFRLFHQSLLANEGFKRVRQTSLGEVKDSLVYVRFVVIRRDRLTTSDLVPGPTVKTIEPASLDKGEFGFSLEIGGWPRCLLTDEEVSRICRAPIGDGLAAWHADAVWSADDDRGDCRSRIWVVGDSTDIDLMLNEVATVFQEQLWPAALEYSDSRSLMRFWMSLVRRTPDSVRIISGYHGEPLLACLLKLAQHHSDQRVIDELRRAGPVYLRDRASQEREFVAHTKNIEWSLRVKDHGIWPDEPV
ncbi:MAG: hypothetical protein H6812_01425 [Phycisphaeraceae bacterium]|nr:hypothetical protein [Phycisphaeraceae bacterium]